MKIISPNLSDIPQRILFIERVEDDFTPLKLIPEEYLTLIIPYAYQYYQSDPTCDMLSQCIRLEDFTIWVHEIFARKDIMLNPYTPVHILALHYMDSGSITAFIQNKVLFSLRQKELNLFNLHSHFHQAPLEAGKNIFSFHINILPNRIKHLTSKFPALAPLLNRNISPIDSGALNDLPLKINPVSSMLIESIFKCRYIEVSADFYLYRCCADLLQNFVVKEQFNHYTMGPKKERLMLKVFEFVKSNIHKRLTPSYLAKKFGFFESDLEESFFHLFGISVEAFILQQRMMKAYDLMGKTKLSLIEIAAVTGHQDIKELTILFRDYYGCEPTTIRNDQ